MPNRLIKDSIHTSDDVNRMTDFQFRLWISLICYVDDFGRGDARPAIIKGACFPLRDRVTLKDIDTALAGLADIGCVSLYTVDGKPYLCLPSWDKHQRVQSKRSRFPSPDIHGESRKVTVSHGESRKVSVDYGDSPSESNPIQSESNTNPNTNPTRARGWVELTDVERDELSSELGERELTRCLEYLESYLRGNSNKYGWTDWPHIIRRCSRERWGIKSPSGKKGVLHEADIGLTGGDDVDRAARIFSTMKEAEE